MSWEFKEDMKNTQKLKELKQHNNTHLSDIEDNATIRLNEMTKTMQNLRTEFNKEPKEPGAMRFQF